MKLSNANVKTGLACLAVVAMGAGLSLLSPATLATTASADTGATTYSSDTLLMHDEVSYSADGITFKITVPDKYIDSLEKKERDSSSGVLYGEGWSYNWERLFELSVLITRAEKVDGYTNVVPQDLYSNLYDNGFVSYSDFYRRTWDKPAHGADEKFWLVDSNANYHIESYFFSTDSKIVSNAAQLPQFDENNTAYFTIPHAEDEDKEYYYYAQIVSPFLETRATFGWTGFSCNVSLVENIPFEGGEMFYGTELLFAPDLVRQKLEDENIELTKEERQRLQGYIGVPSYGEQIETTIYYKTLANKNDPTSVENRSQTIFLPAEYAQRKGEAMAQFNLKGQQDGTWGDGSSYFNVNYYGAYVEDGVVYETGNRIVLQVDPNNPYVYEYDYETNTASITVNYFDYQYKEVALKVTNNDPEDAQNLTMYVYTNDVTVSGNTCTITWNYEKVSTYMKNSANWLCKIKEDNVTANSSEYWTVNKNENEVSVTFDARNQNQLVELDISVNAEIVEDYECSFWVCYTKVLGWDSSAKKMNTELVTKPFTMMYSDMKKYQTLDNLEVLAPDLYNEIENAGKIGDVVFAAPVGIDVEESVGENTYWLSVVYEHPKYFVLENNLNSDVKFFKASGYTSNEFYLKNLIKPSEIPQGYRVKEVTFDEEFIIVVNDAERPDDYQKTKIIIDKVSDSQFYLASIEYTDFFNLEIEYFETYVSVYGEKTPFAIKKTFNTEVKVSDFSGENGIYDIKYADVCRLLGKEDLIVCEIINADSDFNVEYDGVSTYTISITYSKASVRLINEHGTITENSIPLTRYVDWLEMMGNDDWTILMLNNEKNKYFRFSNDIAREELYGLFSVAFFEKQVSDIADWFEKETENGCAVLWETEEVYGSDYYKWCQSTQGKTLGFSETCMWLCEVFDTSQLNATLKYKFFYIDETVDGLYLSNGGADNDHDNDNSLINGGQDLWDGITGGINQFLKSGEEIFVVLRIVAGVALAGGAVFLVIWGLSKLGIIKSKTVMVEQKPKTGRKDEGKKK